MSKNELEPCPFCGCESIYVDVDSEGYYLECNICLAQGPRKETQLEAERAWNGRNKNVHPGILVRGCGHYRR